MRGLQPVGYHHVLGFAVALDLLAHVDARLPVPQFQFVGHERIAFALAHAGLERQLEQQGPHLQIFVRPAFAAPGLRHRRGGLDHALGLFGAEHVHVALFHARGPDPPARVDGYQFLELGLVEHHLQAHVMVLQRARREPRPQRARAQADVFGGQVLQSDVADDLAARPDPSGPRPVRGRLDARSIVRQPSFAVVLQQWRLRAGHEAGAFHLRHLRVEARSGLGLGLALRLDAPWSAGGRIAVEFAAVVPRPVLVPEHAARASGASSRVRHDASRNDSRRSP